MNVVKILEGRNAQVEIAERSDGYFTYRTRTKLTDGWSPAGPDAGIYDSAASAEAEARSRVWWLAANE